ncbi:MAG: Xaa-Pro peptidase family protein [Candidatus Thioglobus autotrophicus]|nr:Xaa-Pro peptidase family protein [Candidatus Thioglobus autotrophicus]
MQNKINSLKLRMKDNNVDLVVLGPGTHMNWLLGFNPYPDERPCMLLIGKEKEAFLMPSVNAEDAKKRTDIAINSWKDENGPDQALKEALLYIGESSAKHIAIDEAMRSHFALIVIEALPNPTYEFTASTIGALRMRKDQTEFINLKENALIDDRAMQAGFAAIKEGVTELEIGEAINKHFISEGAKPQFCIVGSGPNGAFPHHHTGDRKVEYGDAVLIDIGGRKGTFPSDMTRMSVLGEPPEGYLEIHAIVERAVQAAMSAAKPGVMAKEVDAAARNVITEAGYGDYFVHRTGHGLGIDIHEPPYITATSEVELDEGMVFSIEPGIYLQGRFGVRLEEIVILRTDGPEILSELTRELNVIT